MSRIVKTGCPGGGLFVVENEVGLLLTAMRRGARWSSHSHQVIDTFLTSLTDFFIFTFTLDPFPSVNCYFFITTCLSSLLKHCIISTYMTSEYFIPYIASFCQFLMSNLENKSNV